MLVTLAATSSPWVTVPLHAVHTVAPMAARLFDGSASVPSEVTETTSTMSPDADGAVACTVIVAEPPEVSRPSAHRPSAPGCGDASTGITPAGSTFETTAWSTLVGPLFVTGGRE